MLSTDGRLTDLDMWELFAHALFKCVAYGLVFAKHTAPHAKHIGVATANKDRCIAAQMCGGIQKDRLGNLVALISAHSNVTGKACNVGFILSVENRNELARSIHTKVSDRRIGQRSFFGNRPYGCGNGRHSARLRHPRAR